MDSGNVQDWQELIAKMSALLCKLTSDTLRSQDNPGKLPERGIYVFYEDGKPIYVGRTNSMRRRIREHGSESRSATFAYLLAKKALCEQGVKPAQKSGKPATKLTNADVDKHPCIVRQMASRVRKMQIRVVEVNDAIEQTIFEVYAALQLDTMMLQGGYNDFDNH